MDSIRILIVDDEPDLSKFVKIKLSRSAPHFSISTAFSGPDCLAFIDANGPVDCIISDYQMPGMNGIELLRALRTRGDETPFIFFTGQGDEEVASEAFRSGASDYYTKDAGFAHFLRIVNAIEKAVSRHRAVADLEKAETALSEGDFWIRESQRVAMLGSYVLDIKSGKWSSSDVLNEIFGISADAEKTVESWHAILHPEDREKMSEYLQSDVLVQKMPFDADYRIVRVNDGAVRWVSGRGRLILDDSGTPIKMLGTIQDITERKAAEQAVTESEKLFRGLAEYAADAFFLHDGEGRLLDVNQQACESLGYTRDELLGMSVADIDKSYTAPDLAEVWKRVNSCRAVTIEGAHCRKDGTTFPVEVRIGAIEVSGRPLILALARDISKRRQSEDALRKSDRRIMAIMDNIPDIAWLKDTESRFIAVNGQFGQACGIPPVELTGKTDYDLWPAELAGRYRDDDMEVLASGKSKKVEEPLVDKDGNLTWIETIKTPFFNESGKAAGTVGIARDITDRKFIEQQRTEFQEMVTHDIRSPLSSIMGYAELIMDTADNKGNTTLAEMSRNIFLSGRKIASLVDDFATMSSLASGGINLNLEPVDVSDLLKEVREEYEPVTKKKGLELKLELPARPLMALLDRRQVERAVGNLLQNAINYTPRGGVVVLRAESKPEGIVITVTDTGPGIAAGERDRVFNKYYRSPSVAGTKGTGLGLAIVKGVVESHGGWVELATETGKGSEFRIILPRVR